MFIDSVESFLEMVGKATIVTGEINQAETLNLLDP